MSRRTLAILALASIAGASQAAYTTYFGADYWANSTDPRPNSNAAAAAFDTAAGTVAIHTFESDPLGPFGSIAMGGNATLTGIDYNTSNQTVVNSPVGTPDRIYGYNTTAGGSQWASGYGGSMDVAYSSPTNLFGAYMSGQQGIFGPCVVSFFDGSSWTDIDFGGTFDADGGVCFVGFINDTANVTAVHIEFSADIVGMDDVRLNGVPEPASLAVLGLGALAIIRRRKA